MERPAPAGNATGALPARSDGTRVRAFLRTMVATERAVIRAGDRAELLGGVCDALVGSGAFVTAWIGADTNDDGRSVSSRVALPTTSTIC